MIVLKATNKRALDRLKSDLRKKSRSPVDANPEAYVGMISPQSEIEMRRYANRERSVTPTPGNRDIQMQIQRLDNNTDYANLSQEEIIGYNQSLSLKENGNGSLMTSHINRRLSHTNHQIEESESALERVRPRLIVKDVRPKSHQRFVRPRYLEDPLEIVSQEIENGGTGSSQSKFDNTISVGGSNL